ncbi:MAG: AhpC/TSA family protein [Actinomycetota bacterium]|nr:AhpC/TSA family protein [Actinomycetota bacterium]
MRDRYEDFRAKGAEIAAIGMGLTAMAADFKEKQGIPFPLLVDRRRETHRAFELQRGTLLEVAGPRQVARGIKSFLTGNVQGRPAPKQDVLQLGGAMVIDRGGDVLYTHRARSADDNASADELLEALP